MNGFGLSGLTESHSEIGSFTASHNINQKESKMSTNGPKVTEAKLENEELVRKQKIEIHRLQMRHWKYATESLFIRDESEALIKYERDKGSIIKLMSEHGEHKEYLDAAMARNKNAFDKKIELIKKYSLED
jgi:hypothetical protein